MDEFYFSLKWLLETRISVQKVLMFFLKHCGGVGGGGGGGRAVMFSIAKYCLYSRSTVRSTVGNKLTV